MPSLSCVCLCAGVIFPNKAFIPFKAFAVPPKFAPKSPAAFAASSTLLRQILNAITPAAATTANAARGTAAAESAAAKGANAPPDAMIPPSANIGAAIFTPSRAIPPPIIPIPRVLASIPINLPFSSCAINGIMDAIPNPAPNIPALPAIPLPKPLRPPTRPALAARSFSVCSAALSSSAIIFCCLARNSSCSATKVCFDV